MGSTEGGTKSHQTLKQKLGPEGYSEHMASIGARGGKAKVRKGGLLNPENRKRAADAQDLHTRVQKSERPESDTD